MDVGPYPRSCPPPPPRPLRGQELRPLHRPMDPSAVPRASQRKTFLAFYGTNRTSRQWTMKVVKDHGFDLQTEYSGTYAAAMRVCEHTYCPRFGVTGRRKSAD